MKTIGKCKLEHLESKRGKPVELEETKWSVYATQWSGNSKKKYELKIL